MNKQCLTLQRLFFCFMRLSENIFNIKRLTLLVLWTYRHDILAGGGYWMYQCRIFELE